jgi:NADH:ubiquinone oxidoreductase subunit 6 (subunit J)
MVGKLIAGSRGNWLKQKLGAAWRYVSLVAIVGYSLLTLITLSVMLVYLANSNDIPRPASYWVTIFAGLWMTYNIIYELTGFFIRSRIRDTQSIHV